MVYDNYLPSGPIIWLMSPPWTNLPLTILCMAVPAYPMILPSYLLKPWQSRLKFSQVLGHVSSKSSKTTYSVPVEPL